VRTIELAQAQKSEFDIPRREWIIPAERMKMKRDHLVPLSAQAVEIVETQIATTSNSDWLFPHQFKPRQHMSNGTVLGSIKRLGYSGQMTGHGFRALAMTAIQEQLGYPRHVIDRQLAHARKSQVDAAYDRAEFIVERRKMMQEWADYLDKLLVQVIQPPLRKADQPPLTTR
jgi:integrase